MEIKEFLAQGVPVSLEISPSVFTPSRHGQYFAQHFKINLGEKVIDVGTGTGFFAILAAKLGAQVSGTDITDESIILAKRNAELNKVQVDFRKGDLFSPFEDEVFDVILANVPQELLSPKIQQKLNKYDLVSFNGEEGGCSILIKTLEKAKQHMHAGSRLYVMVYTMTHYRKTLEYIVKNYSVKLIDFHSVEIKDFINEDREFYSSDKEINIYKVENEEFADVFVFELRVL